MSNTGSDPKGSSQPPFRESLEDLVYRSSLAEGNRAVRGAGLRSAGPVALAVYGLLATGVFLAARHTVAGQKVVQSVAIVLQEGPEPPAQAPGPARSVPAPVVHPPAAPALRAPAPPPPTPLQAPPPPVPAAVAAPVTVPTALPQEDHSRDYGSGAPGKGGGGGSAAPGTGPVGTPGGGGGGAGQVLTLDLSRIEVLSRPPKPDYPLLAQKAGIQGSVVVPILVGADGVPSSAKAVDGPPLLRSAAEKFALAWRFAPYRVNGVAHAFQFTLTVTFTLKR